MRPVEWVKKPLQIMRRVVDLVFLKKMPLEELADYDEYWNKRPHVPIKYRFEYIASQLPERCSLLDIGCGSGTFLTYLKGVKPNVKTKGVDISEAAISKLREHGIDGLVMDLTTQSFPDGMEFDYVTMMEVLEHLHNAEFLMRGVKKLRAKKYFVTIPNPGHLGNRLRLAIGGKMPLTHVQFHTREHIRFWTVSDFKYWSKCMGYKLIRYKGQGGFPLLWRICPSLFAEQLIYILEVDRQNA